MSWMQLAVICVASGFNCIGIVSHTIATQNEKSGFITSIAYVSLIYAFCGDLFIFEQIFSVQETIGVAMIVLVIGYMIYESL